MKQNENDALQDKKERRELLATAFFSFVQASMLMFEHSDNVDLCVENIMKEKNFRKNYSLLIYIH